MNYRKILKSNLFIFLSFLVIFYAIFRYSESFNKGYNAIEDYAIIETNQALETKSFVSVYEDLMKMELDGHKRIRPMWVFYFLTSVKLFGFNLLLLNIYIVLLCIITSFILFKFCKNIGFSSIQSYLFAFLTLIGPATIIYSRPPDAEIIGMLLLSITLFFLSKSIFSPKNQLFYKACFVIFILFTSLSKESFLILVPSILILYIWLYSSKNNTGIFQTLKKNSIIIGIVTMFSVTILYSIIKLLGKNQNTSYSGVNINLFSYKTLIDFLNTVVNTDMFLIFLLGLFIFIENELQKNKLSSDYFKKHLKNLLVIFVLILSIIVPQFILYYKTGFVERYYLFYLIGYAFLLVYILRIIFESTSISSFIKYLYLSTIIMYLSLTLIANTIPSISSFTKYCNATEEVVNYLKKSPNNTTLIVLDPAIDYHKFYSLNIYLNHLKIKNDYKFDFIKLETKNKFFSDTSFYNRQLNFAKKKVGENLINNGNEIYEFNSILLFTVFDKPFIEKNKKWFNASEYKKKSNYFYTFYYK